MSSTYVVTAALAVIKDGAGKLRYYYTGAVLPEDLPAEELTRLAKRGLIAPADPPEPVADAEQSAPADTPPAVSGSDPDRPLQVATKAAWVDYAVARGMDQAAAEAMTKQELINALSG